MENGIDNIINWDQAKKVNKQLTKEQKQEHEKQIQNFLEENHEIADGRDLQHWRNVTGKDLDWILSNGKGINETLIQILYNGGTLDDVWNYMPPIIKEEDHTEILKYFK